MEKHALLHLPWAAMNYLKIALFLSIITLQVSAQQLKGKVVDSKTGGALAFVTIAYKDSLAIGQSDIEGHFSIKVTNSKHPIFFTYVGYEPYLFTGRIGEYQQIRLSPKSIALREVIVKMGENPADRLIRKVIANKDKNNPEKLTSFTYTAYNKFIITKKEGEAIDTFIPPKKADQRTLDSLRKRHEVRSRKTDSVFKTQHFFIAESVSERQFSYPELSKETIKASRISGLKNPNFTLLASEFQSFSFYDTYLKILDKKYLSPISTGATDHYFFNIEDTTFSATDTTYILSFKPRKGKIFDGLKGLLYINSQGYAVQNVVTEPNEISDLAISIQQLYKRIDNQYWFPVQLNTELSFGNAISVNDRQMVGSGRTYIDSIQIGLKIPKKEFNHIAVGYDPNALKNANELLLRYRNDTLDDREKRTYVVMDSIGKEENLDKKLGAFEALSTGSLRLGYLQLDLNRLLNYNSYEGYRLGVGLSTSNLFSTKFQLGAYTAYGFSDQGLKYGAFSTLQLNRDYQVQLGYRFMQDVIESGSTDFYNDPLRQEERFRYFFVSKMDRLQQQELFLSGRIGYLQSTLFTKLNRRDASIFYSTIDGKSSFDYVESGISFRYAFRETFVQQPNRILSLGTKYPVLFVQLAQIHALQPSSFSNCYRIDAKLNQSFILRNAGTFHIQLSSGWMNTPAIPLSLLYTGYANRNTNLSIIGKNNFETMGMNNFISSRYAQTFIAHNFGNLLVKTKSFAPELVLSYNALYGDKLTGTIGSLKTADKVYQETGVTVNNILLLKTAFLTQGLGLGAFYRLGAYSSATAASNLVIKLAYLLSF